MFSVFKMGTCRRPSCTAIVRPTISGMIVDRRAQVRITVFSPDLTTCSTFFISLGSAKGPFFVERDIEIPTRRTVYARCTCLCPSGGGSGSLASAYPKESWVPAGRWESVPRRRREDDLVESWQCHVPWAGGP